MTRMTLTKAATSFASDESGALAVDWVVLTAGLVGLGLAVMGVISTGVRSLSNDANDVHLVERTVLTF